LGALSKASGCTLSLTIPANNRRPASMLVALPLMCWEVRQSGGAWWAV
jgi:hypothetical protein